MTEALLFRLRAVNECKLVFENTDRKDTQVVRKVGDRQELQKGTVFVS